MAQTTPEHSAVPMALNGSNFGAASSLEYPYDEKVMGDLASPSYGYQDAPASAHPALPGSTVGVRASNDAYAAYEGTDMDEDYTSYPPPMAHQASNGGAGGAYDSGSEDGHGHAAAGVGADYSGHPPQMAVVNPDHVTYGR
jgi:hypothetical protein